jgi:cyclic pyranopterin phosphate synthase
VPALIEFGKEVGAQVRFIEYMDVGGATRWSMQEVFSRADILRVLEDHYGAIEVDGQQGVDPAQRFRLPDGTRFGIIASVTQPFCRACDRSRLTADGIWYLCLYATEGVNLAQLLHQGASHQDIVEVLQETWSQRRDRGAEIRRAEPVREVLYQVDDLRRDPHREMHTRGG